MEAAIALRDQWSNYHHHKETLATTVALTYIGAGLALPWVVMKPEIKDWFLLGISGSFILIGFTAFWFVIWQLGNRQLARKRIDAVDEALRSLLKVGESETGIDQDLRRVLSAHLRSGSALGGPELPAGWIIASMIATTMVAGAGLIGRAGGWL